MSRERAGERNTAKNTHTSQQQRYSTSHRHTQCFCARLHTLSLSSPPTQHLTQPFQTRLCVLPYQSASLRAESAPLRPAPLSPPSPSLPALFQVTPRYGPHGIHALCEGQARVRVSHGLEAAEKRAEEEQLTFATPNSSSPRKRQR